MFVDLSLKEYFLNFIMERGNNNHGSIWIDGENISFVVIEFCIDTFYEKSKLIHDLMIVMKKKDCFKKPIVLRLPKVIINTILEFNVAQIEDIVGIWIREKIKLIIYSDGKVLYCFFFGELGAKNWVFFTPKILTPKQI